MLRGPHGRLGAQPQPAQSVLLGALDGGEQQLPPDALALRLGEAIEQMAVGGGR